jgi:muramoyltetrapeptide carboxypeptidase
VRGGWGSARILPLLDWKTIRANPKLLIGFSDITALHLAIQARAAFRPSTGPMPEAAGPSYSWESLSRARVRGQAAALPQPARRRGPAGPARGPHPHHPPGQGAGALLGGNLTVLTHLIGTPWLPSFDGAILFIEDVDEAEYRIDRMLTQLAPGRSPAQGCGVVFGQCTDCRATGGSRRLHPWRRAPPASRAARRARLSGAMFGHVDDQFSLPVGCRAEIDADAGTIRLLESPVA